MVKKGTRQRIYASLLALGACILLYLTIAMISQGALGILAVWVSILLLAEMLIDLGCLLGSLRWWMSRDRAKGTIALR